MRTLLCVLTYVQLSCETYNFKVDTCIRKVVHDYALRSILYAFENEYILGSFLNYTPFEDNYILGSFPNYTLTAVEVTQEAQNLGGLDFYIFSIRNVKNLQNFLSKLQFSQQYSSSTPVVAYIENATVSETLEVFWMYNLINVLVLTEDLIWYTYYPISQGNCGNIDPSYLFKCKEYISSSSIFNESSAKYFENCVLRIYAIVVPPFVFPGDLETNNGAEMVLLRNVLELLRATPKYFNHQFVTYGVVLINGSETSVFDEVHKNRAELVLGFAKFEERQANLISPFFSHFNFYAPIAAPAESWKNIFLVFDVQVWCYTILLLLVLPLFWSLCSSNQSLSYSFLLVTKLLLSPGQYTPGDLKTSILYVFWIFTAFLVISFYQSVLISVIFKPAFEPQVATLEQMVHSRYRYGGTPLVRNFFRDSDNPIWQKIYDNYYSCIIATDGCVTKALKDQDLCILIPQQMASYFLQRAKGTLYKIDYEVYTRISMIMQFGSPMLPRMEQVIGRMADAGLVAKWDVYGKLAEIRAIASNNQVAMTLSHLKSSFAILTLGIFIATVAFIAECLSKSVHCHSNI